MFCWSGRSIVPGKYFQIEFFMGTLACNEENVWCFLSKKSRVNKNFNGLRNPIGIMASELVLSWSQEEYMECGKSISVGIVLFVFLLTLSACGSKTKDNQNMNPEQDPAAIGKEEPLESKKTGILEGRTTGPMFPIYFGYDSHAIRDDQKPRIQVNADFLTEEQMVTIRIEGNCDSRGTREYNLALGEKRALSAKKYLVNLGVASGRISTVSLGEEKILIHGHDEMSWAQNRRDDFVVD